MKKFIFGFVAGVLLIAPLLAFSAPSLGAKLRGKILLAVEDKGKTYYVHSDGSRYQITTATAQKIFEKLALGVKNSDLQQIPVKDVGITPEVPATTYSTNTTEKIASSGCVCDYSSYNKKIASLQLENQKLSTLCSAASSYETQKAALNKKYGLEINELQKQLLEISYLNLYINDIKSYWYSSVETSSKDDGQDLSYKVINVDNFEYADTDYKKQLITRMFTYFLKLRTTNRTNDITNYLAKEKTSINSNIASLQNELDRKLLELQ